MYFMKSVLPTTNSKDGTQKRKKWGKLQTNILHKYRCKNSLPSSSKLNPGSYKKNNARVAQYLETYQCNPLLIV